jgi:hypothetical protein
MRKIARRTLILIVIVIALLALVCVSAWLIVWLPERELTTLKNNLTEKEIVELKNNIRLTYAQILGGMAILVGLFFTALRLRALEKEAQIAKDGQITERFSKAVEQLGSENSAVCLGGVYALERIAHDSQYDHWSIMEILTTFVRDKAGWQTEEWNAEMSDIDELVSIEIARTNLDWEEFYEVSGDFKPRYPHEEKPPKRISIIIQTIMTVIGRRALMHEKGRPDRLNLRRTDLPKNDDEPDNLIIPPCTWANLTGADLRDANLFNTNLAHCTLNGTDLRGVDLSYTAITPEQLKQAKVNDKTKLPVIRPYKPQK